MTVRTFSIVAVAAALIVPMIAAWPAVAQKAEPAKVVVGIVDAQSVLQRSLAMKTVRDQMEEERKKFQAEISAEEQKLRAESDQLRRQRGVLAPQAFARKREELQSRIAKLQHRVETTRQEIGRAYSDSLREFQKALVAVVEEISKERGFTLVLDQRQVIFTQDSMVITEEALERVNKRLPVLKLAMPGKDAPPKTPAAGKPKEKKK